MKRPISEKRRRLAERAHASIEKLMRSVPAAPALLPDDELRRVLHGVAVASDLIGMGLPGDAAEILARLTGPVPAKRKKGREHVE